MRLILGVSILFSVIFIGILLLLLRRRRRGGRKEG
jgi:hypothetical protein